MISAILASCTLLAAPRTLKAEVQAASMFKNGFAVMTRTIEIPSSGEYVLAEIPQASLGTLWFGTTNGIKIREITNTSQSKTTKTNAASIDNLLDWNVGKTLRLGMKNGDEVTKNQIVGKLLSSTGQIVLLDTGSDVVAIPKASITSLSAVSGSLKLNDTAKYGQRVLRFVVDAPKAGQITMLSMERGLTWTPGYAVDITDPKKLKLVAKATISNDLEDLNGIQAKFVTGFPNTPYAFQLDPLTQSSDFSQMQTMGRVSGFGGGSFGARGGSMDQMTQNAAAPLSGSDFSGAMDPSLLSGDQLGDLFFYKQPNVRLKKGDRSYFMLFSAEADYSHLYTWEIADAVQNDADYRPIDAATPQEYWHTVRFKNTSGQPFTTGVATTIHTGEILGQDQIKYTPPGAETELRITKALDIRAEADEEEVSRERQSLRLWNGVAYDLVTLKGTLLTINQKREKVSVKITKEITGDLGSSDNDAEVIKIAKRLSAVNSRARLVWKLSLDPGQTMKLTYTYKVYVRG